MATSDSYKSNSDYYEDSSGTSYYRSYSFDWSIAWSGSTGTVSWSLNAHNSATDGGSDYTWNAWWTLGKVSGTVNGSTISNDSSYPVGTKVSPQSGKTFKSGSFSVTADSSGNATFNINVIVAIGYSSSSSPGVEKTISKTVTATGGTPPTGTLAITFGDTGVASVTATHSSGTSYTYTSSGSQSVTAGSYTITATYKDGYEAKSGTGSASVSSGSTTSKTIYSQSDHYTITYNPGSGSGTSYSEASKYASAYEVKSNSFTGPTVTATWNANGGTGGTTTSANRAFTNWSGSNSKTYAAGASIPANTFSSGGTLTLTAQWGTGTCSLPSDPTRTGYIFNGWYNGSTKQTTAPSISSNTTYTASWTAKTCVYTLDLNGGSSTGSTSVTGTYDQVCGTTVPTKSGYTFSGWGTTTSSADRSGTDGKITVAAADVPNDSGNTKTLYAVWTRNTASLEITADANTTVKITTSTGDTTVNNDTKTIACLGAEVVTVTTSYTAGYKAVGTVPSSITAPSSGSASYSFTAQGKSVKLQYQTSSGNIIGSDVTGLVYGAEYTTEIGRTYTDAGISKNITITFDANGGTPATQTATLTAVSVASKYAYTSDTKFSLNGQTAKSAGSTVTLTGGDTSVEPVVMILKAAADPTPTNSYTASGSTAAVSCPSVTGPTSTPYQTGWYTSSATSASSYLIASANATVSAADWVEIINNYYASTATTSGITCYAHWNVTPTKGVYVMVNHAWKLVHSW